MVVVMLWLCCVGSRRGEVDGKKEEKSMAMMWSGKGRGKTWRWRCRSCCRKVSTRSDATCPCPLSRGRGRAFRDHGALHKPGLDCSNKRQWRLCPPSTIRIRWTWWSLQWQGSIVFILQHPFYFYYILSLFLTIRHLAISTRHVCSPVLNNNNNNNNPLIKTRNDRDKTKQNKQWINNHLVPETCLCRGRKQTKKTLEI